MIIFPVPLGAACHKNRRGKKRRGERKGRGRSSPGFAESLHAYSLDEKTEDQTLSHMRLKACSLFYTPVVLNIFVTRLRKSASLEKLRNADFLVFLPDFLNQKL